MQVTADRQSQIIIPLRLSLGKQFTVAVIQDIFRNPFPDTERETVHIDSIGGKVNPFFLVPVFCLWIPCLRFRHPASFLLQSEDSLQFAYKVSLIGSRLDISFT